MRRLLSLTFLLVLVLAPAAQAAPAAKRLPVAWAAANKLTRTQGARDTDRDGLINWGEYRAGTNPRKRDSDRDGITDALEDRDHDHLTNAEELAAGTDPRKRDSDRDRVPDGREDRDRDGLANRYERATGHDLTKRDSDGDGVLDGRDNAGWVTTASPTSVTIRLAVGGTLTGRLTADSWVDCTASAPATTVGSTGTSTTGSGSESGGTGEPGDTTEDPTGSEPDVDVPALDDDPAALPAAFRADQASAAQGDGDDDFAGDTEPGPVDLGACGANLRVGAVVHQVAVEADQTGPLVTALELMQR